VDLEPTEEQTLLSDTVDELLARAVGDDGIVPDEAAERVWQGLVEFGALELAGDREPDARLGAVELALVARALGARLAAVPYVDSAAVRYALAGAGHELEAGPAIAFAASEPGRTFAPADPAAILDAGRLTGEKSSVAHAATVDSLAVPAAAADGLALALVPADAATAIEAEDTLDPGLHPALVRFDGVAVAPASVVADTGAGSLVERLAATAGVLACAEAVGAAGAVLGLARDYAAGRRQFGRTIGSFQAVRHLLAEMYVKTESSWSSVLYAAASLDEDEPDALRTASIAKSYAARATLDVAHGALQVFGGVAFTAEHPAHRFLRRIAARGSQFGTAREHERNLGRGLALEVEVLA
jgi:alkylation response protein AidB-like acyl-CoA dehydrogenase